MVALTELVALYRRGSAAPLPLFPSASWAFALALKADPTDRDTALSEPNAVAKALQRAESAWSNLRGGDLADPHVRKLFGERFPGIDPEEERPDPAFTHASLDLFAAIVAARRVNRVAKGWVSP
jgi:exonuclease V gamma subunit